MQLYFFLLNFVSAKLKTSLFVNTNLISGWVFLSHVTGEELEYFDITDFKKKFKRGLRSALKNVRINPF